MNKIKAIDIAKYIYDKYFNDYHMIIDEMKMHKLLYFVQRESLIQTNSVMFDEIFYGWKYGPVLKEIREAYKLDLFSEKSNNEIAPEQKKIIDEIYYKYSDKNSWNLSNLSHNEYSWKQSRKGMSEYENGNVVIKVEDIKKDALLQKMKRMLIDNVGK